MPPTLATPHIITPTNIQSTMFAGMQVTPAKQLRHDKLCALIYSFGGVGKTTLVGMLSQHPSSRRTLLVDAEGGATAVANRDNIDVVQASKWSEIDAVLREFEQQSEASKAYGAVAFDNLSEYQMVQLATITSINAEIGIQHWGRNTANMLSFTRRVRDLSRFKGVHTMMLAWQDSEEDDVTGKVRHTVALTNKLAKRLPGVVNLVGHLTVVDNPPLYTRKLDFAASPRTDAKFRRAAGDSASPIPLELYYGLEQNPIVDMLNTLYEDIPFPVNSYKRPVGRTNTANTVTPQDGEKKA
jgi:phage nucleotide-binding protein